MADTSKEMGGGYTHDRNCYRRGGSCACGGGVCGKEVRATPPSPSTAPELDELPKGVDAALFDWGQAVKSGTTDDKLRTRKALIAVIRHNREAAVQIALASRPAEVDDEGLPPLPRRYGTAYPGNYWTASEQDTPAGTGIVAVYTAEQYRQGQRDAVAADRARRGELIEHGQKMSNWLFGLSNSGLAYPSWTITCAELSLKWDRLVAPSHTTNQEK